MPFNHADPERTIDPALQALKERGWVSEGQTAVMISSISVSDQIVDAVQMRTL